MRYIVVIIIVLLGTDITIGQRLEQQLMSGLPQSYINPAFESDTKYFIGLIAGQFNFGNDAFDIGDAFLDKEGSKVLNTDRLVQLVSDENLARFSTSINAIELGYKINDNVLLYGGYGWHSSASLLYTDDLINLLALGNEPFIENPLDIGPNLDYNMYNETMLGVSGQAKRLRYGVRFKLINGAQHLSTPSSQAIFNTSSDIYQLSLDMDYAIQSANVLRFNSIDDVDLDFTAYSLNNYLAANWGYGIDLGLSTQLGRAEVFMSVTDIGRIQWTQKTKLYTNRSLINFDGLDISDFLTTDPGFSVGDSLKSLLDLSEIETSFSTPLPSRIHMGASFDINSKYKVGAILMREVLPTVNVYAATLQGQRSFGNHLNFGLSWSYRDRSFANIGCNLQWKYKAINTYIATHNIISAITPSNTKSFSISGGFLLGFNDKKSGE